MSEVPLQCLEWTIHSCRAAVGVRGKGQGVQGLGNMLPELGFGVVMGDGQRWPRGWGEGGDFILQNISINRFLKVTPPIKSSTDCLLLLIERWASFAATSLP